MQKSARFGKKMRDLAKSRLGKNMRDLAKSRLGKIMRDLAKKCKNIFAQFNQF